MVGEDKVHPWRAQWYMEENHREMMEVDKVMTPCRTPRIRQLLRVVIIVIVNMWTS